MITKQPDFMPIEELSRATTIRPKTLYNQHSSGQGALAPILVKIGGRLGCWRADYEAWKASQRRIPSPDTMGGTQSDVRQAMHALKADEDDNDSYADTLRALNITSIA